jgi:hypothetical protein
MMQDPTGLRAMGERGRRAVCDGFDRRVQATQIEEVFASLHGPRTSGRVELPDAALPAIGSRRGTA